MAESLSKEITDEIRFILEGIKSGKLKHNQQLFHSTCKTKHCLAGWKEILDIEKLGLNPLDLPWTERKSMGGDYLVQVLDASSVLGKYPSPWYYAREAWKLTDGQAYQLFNREATLAEQFTVLEQLELKGKHYDSNDN